MRSSDPRTEAGGGVARLAPRSVPWFALLGLLSVAACGGDGPTEPAGPPAQLEKSGGDGQAWYFGNPLPEDYSVVVRDANGRRVPGVSVTWAVTSGGGSVGPATSVTNGDGVATTTHTLGPAAVTQTVTANAASLSEVEFTASATSPPTSAAVSVLNTDRFSPRDVVVQVDGTVTWTWGPDQSDDHNVIFSSGPASRPPNSPTQRSGTYSATFTGADRYHYFCSIHAGMEGTVSVVN